MSEQEMKSRYHVILTFWKFLKDRMEHFEDTDAYWEITVGIADKLFEDHFRNTDAEDFAASVGACMMNELARMARIHRRKKAA